jgi:hypothetical protein
MLINILLPVSLLLVAADAGLITIQVQFLDAGSGSNVGGAFVNCFDEDTPDEDDFMASGETTSDGKARINYQTKPRPTFESQDIGWDSSPNLFTHNPDIYCIITKDGNYPVSTLFVAMDLLCPFRSAL